eukprot:3067660-Karenia_brevis.AAC.1
MRVQRAAKSKTRQATEIQELERGSLVDIWFEPTTKDQPGWRGPAGVASVNAQEGNVSVRYQGRTLDRRRAE